MKKLKWRKSLAGLITLLLLTAAVQYILIDRTSDRAVMLSARLPGQTLIIDAGHGGEDGGAVSISGAVESKINLAIALRLNDILGLYGVNTLMLRTEDNSLHNGNASTLREKKVSDLHNRVDAIESVSNATLISIHQNIFNNKNLHGAQVFFSNEKLSLPFAQYTQETLRLTLDPQNTRKAAKIPTTVYLMNHITCRAILVECGFLSNPTEDSLLQTGNYQIKIAAALAGSYLSFQDVAPPEGDHSNEI